MSRTGWRTHLSRSLGSLPILALLLLFAGAAEAQTWAGTDGLTLSIKSRSGGAVAGATVAIGFLDDPSLGGPPPAETDGNGNVELRGLASGLWQVSVRHPDYLGYEARVELRGNKRPREVRAMQVQTGGATETLRVRYGSVRRAAYDPRDADRDDDRAARQRRERREAEVRERERREREQAQQRAEAERKAREEARERSQREATRRERESASRARSPEPEPARPTTPVPEVEPVEPDRVPETAVAPPPVEPEPPPPAAPEPASADAVRPVTPERPAPRPEPAAPPPTDVREPAPEPEPVAPAPEPPAPTYLRSSRDRSCIECRPGEWSVSSVGSTSRTGATSCPDRVRDTLEELATTVAEAPLADFSGPLEPPHPRVAASVPRPEVELPQGCELLAVKLPAGATFKGFQLEVEVGGRVLPCLPDEDCPGGTGRWQTLPAVERRPAGASVAALFGHSGTNPDARPRLTIYFVPSGRWTPSP